MIERLLQILAGFSDNIFGDPLAPLLCALNAAHEAGTLPSIDDEIELADWFRRTIGGGYDEHAVLVWQWARITTRQMLPEPGTTTWTHMSAAAAILATFAHGLPR